MNKDRLLGSKEFDSKLEKIRAWFVNTEIQLTPTEEELRIRLESAFTLLCKYHSNEQARERLMTQFGYKSAQAYRDIRSAIDLFGDVVKIKKETSRYILYELAMKNYQLAASKTDVEQMNKALANLIKITGVDRDDFDLPDPSKIQPPVQILSIQQNFIQGPYFKHADKSVQEGLLKLQAQIQEVIDKNPFKEYLDMIQVVDIPHKEISNGD